MSAAVTLHSKFNEGLVKHCDNNVVNALFHVVLHRIIDDKERVVDQVDSLGVVAILDRTVDPTKPAANDGVGHIGQMHGHLVSSESRHDDGGGHL